MKNLMFLLLLSCAATSYTLMHKDMQPYKESGKVTKLNMLSKKVTINSVADLRKSSDVGYAYTGVEYKKTPVYLNAQPSLMIKDYLEQSLRQRNIQVVPNGEFVLEVNILKPNIHELIMKNQPEKARCEVSLEFSGQADKTQWSGKFSTEFTSAGDMTDGTERLAPTLASCLNDLVEKLIADEKFLSVLAKGKQ